MRLGTWLGRQLPPLEYLIEPWLPVGGIILLHGPRGVSKTNIAMGIALEVAQGSPFLQYPVPKARKVLYIDGEMQRSLVQDRLRKFARHTQRPRALENLEYINYADLGVPEGFGDLAQAGSYGRHRIDEEIGYLRDFEEESVLLILDNKSCLVSTPDSNSDGPELHSFMRWMLDLRAKNVSTLLIHHDGKQAGRQHGSSALERYPDTIIGLTATDKPQNGCIPVTWAFEKSRSSTPDETESYLNIRYDDAQRVAWLEMNEAPPMDSLEPDERAVLSVKEMNPELSIRAIAGITRFGRNKVYGILKKHGVETAKTPNA